MRRICVEGVGDPQSQGGDGDVDSPRNIYNIREIGVSATPDDFDPVGWLMNGAYEAECAARRFDMVYTD